MFNCDHVFRTSSITKKILRTKIEKLLKNLCKMCGKNWKNPARGRGKKTVQGKNTLHGKKRYFTANYSQKHFRIEAYSPSTSMVSSLLSTVSGVMLISSLPPRLSARMLM